MPSLRRHRAIRLLDSVQLGTGLAGAEDLCVHCSPPGRPISQRKSRKNDIRYGQDPRAAVLTALAKSGLVGRAGDARLAELAREEEESPIYIYIYIYIYMYRVAQLERLLETKRGITPNHWTAT